MLRAEVEVWRERCRRLEVKVAELERRLGSDSTTSGTPASEDSIEARERREAERKKEGQVSERERRKDRGRGGQPGHLGAGLPRDPGPGERAEVPPAQCSRCGAGLEDAGFDAAMQAAWEQEPVLAADETPVNLLGPHAGLARDEAGALHVLGRAHPVRRADLAAGARIPASRRDHRGPVLPAS